jgi:hypothetical protein
MTKGVKSIAIFYFCGAASAAGVCHNRAGPVGAIEESY